MNAQTTHQPTATVAPKCACQRCGHKGDRLANIRGLRLCGLCSLIAKVQAGR